MYTNESAAVARIERLEPEQLPCRAAVLLASRDAIVPSQEIERSLRAHVVGGGCGGGLHVEMHERFDHGRLMVQWRPVLTALAELRSARAK